jgi:hypothetical protein
MFRTAAMIGSAIAVLGMPAFAWAEPPASAATEFSSQQQHKKKTNVPHSKNVSGQQFKKSSGQQFKKSSSQQFKKSSSQQFKKSSGQQFKKSTGQQFKKSGGQQFKKSGGQQFKKSGGQQFKKSTGQQFKKSGGQQIQKFGGVGGQKFVPLKPGPGQVFKPKPGNFPVVKLGNKFAPVWKKGPKKIWWGGGWKTFVPLTVLGAVVIGGGYYYADGYLALARPYCDGFTPDGCRLNWQRVDFLDGGSEWQCVQYCPRVGAPPPPRTVALVAPPPLPQGGCEISIFSEPDFRGTNATANDEQPVLSEIGWQNQIASVQVKSGTWDFFSDPEFTGETMRLQPGDYPDLGPQWTKHSGSFMCVQP